MTATQTRRRLSSMVAPILFAVGFGTAFTIVEIRRLDRFASPGSSDVSWVIVLALAYVLLAVEAGCRDESSARHLKRTGTVAFILGVLAIPVALSLVPFTYGSELEPTWVQTTGFVGTGGVLIGVVIIGAGLASAGVQRVRSLLMIGTAVGSGSLLSIMLALRHSWPGPSG